MADRSIDTRERYVAYATHCLQLAKVAADNQSRAVLRESRRIVLHLDIAHVDQDAQVIRVDRAELQTLAPDVPQRPAHPDGIVQSEARQTRFRFAHILTLSPIR
jgi:hypothetical protein